MISMFRIGRAARPVFLGGLLAAAGSGCGDQSYDSRLKQNTLPFFAHRQELETSLGPWWNGVLTSYRPPQGYELLLPAKSNPLPLPAILPPSLVGVDAIFVDRMNASYEESPGKLATKEVRSDVVVLTNREVLGVKDPNPQPAKFTEYLQKELSRAFNPQNPDVKPPDFSTSRVGGEQFVPQRKYDHLEFLTTHEGVPMKCDLYITRQNELQAAVLFIVPQNSSGASALRKSQMLSLETLTLYPPGSQTNAPVAPSSTGGAPSF